jgi:hypothetical protein
MDTGSRLIDRCRVGWCLHLHGVTCTLQCVVVPRREAPTCFHDKARPKGSNSLVPCSSVPTRACVARGLSMTRRDSQQSRGSRNRVRGPGPARAWSGSRESERAATARRQRNHAVTPPRRGPVVVFDQGNSSVGPTNSLPAQLSACPAVDWRETCQHAGGQGTHPPLHHYPLSLSRYLGRSTGRPPPDPGVDTCWTVRTSTSGQHVAAPILPTPGQWTSFINQSLEDALLKTSH